MSKNVCGQYGHLARDCAWDKKKLGKGEKGEKGGKGKGNGYKGGQDGKNTKEEGEGFQEKEGKEQREDRKEGILADRLSGDMLELLGGWA